MANYIDSRVNIYEEGLFSTVDMPKGTSSHSFNIFHKPVEIWIEGKQYITKDNACILIPANVKRYYKHHHNIYAESWINFEIETGFFEKIQIPINRIFYPNNTDYLVSLIVEVAEKYRSKQPFYKELVSIGLERLLYEASGMNMKNSTQTKISEKNIDIITQIRNDMFNHLDDDWTVQKIADRIHFSKSYTEKLYLRCFQKSIKQDLIGARIRRSKILLLNNYYSIEQVAVKSGFTSVSYFISQFKKHTGMTPKEYIKKMSV